MTSIISGPAISVVNSVLDKEEKTVETRTRKHAQTISKSLYIQHSLLFAIYVGIILSIFCGMASSKPRHLGNEK
ncbi:MAG: hypothetical protein QOK85_06415 [Nitrososphaeraceae archaeon]|nr:hypothetical protein [Nitrososphaeraceae archaeon]